MNEIQKFVNEEFGTIRTMTMWCMRNLFIKASLSVFLLSHLTELLIYRQEFIQKEFLT